jgi:hypothetical protein
MRLGGVVVRSTSWRPPWSSVTAALVPRGLTLIARPDSVPRDTVVTTAGTTARFRKSRFVSLTMTPLGLPPPGAATKEM